ncbi:hypothetical protein J4458_00705 [Candidatus Woesearchaeota archaeon]|nr:hypothetical protein [Candidatus Woesearchaeota archaeon]
MLSREERKKLRLEKLRQQSEQSRLEFEQKKHKETQEQQAAKSKKTRVYIIIAIVFSILIVFIGAYAFINAKKPGSYDNFAKCLTEKGAVMYGASFCQYSSAQKGMFGKSFKFINYKDFSENPDVRITPTWEINGRLVERVQSFDRLSELTGCSIK